MKKTLFITALAMLQIMAVQAESTGDSLKFKIDAGADFKTRFVWRGLLLGNAPHAQGWVEFRHGDFALGSWGTYAGDASYAEVDFYLTYSKNGFQAMFTDVFVEDEKNLPMNDFFTYKDTITGHNLEMKLSYQLQGKIPLQFMAGTYFYGSDRDEKANSYYSTWFEIGYPFSVGSFDARIHVGGTPMEGMYSHEAGITSVGVDVTKTLEIGSKLNIPVNFAVVLNPKAEDLFFAITISL